MTLERLSGSEILKAHCDSFANFILCFIMNSCCILEKPRKMVNYHFKFIFCPKMVSSNENQRVNFIFAQSILLTKEYPLSEISDLWSHKSFEVTFPPSILLWYYSSCWDQWVAIFFFFFRESGIEYWHYIGNSHNCILFFVEIGNWEKCKWLQILG